MQILKKSVDLPEKKRNMNSLVACLRQTHPDDADDANLRWALWHNMLDDNPIPFERTFLHQSRLLKPRKFETTRTRRTCALQPVLLVYSVEDPDHVLYVLKKMVSEKNKGAVVIDPSWMQLKSEADVNELPLTYDVAIVTDVSFHVANYVSYAGIRTIFLTSEAYADVDLGPKDALTTNDFVAVSVPVGAVEETVRRESAAAHKRLLDIYKPNTSVSLVRAFHIPKKDSASV